MKKKLPKLNFKFPFRRASGGHNHKLTRKKKRSQIKFTKNKNNKNKNNKNKLKHTKKHTQKKMRKKN